MPALSILDLAPIPEGKTAAEALRNSLDLAQHAEQWGYRRFWLAEHHNMVGIASAATAVVIGHVAAGTKTIRVGAGGIMLPNHSPLVIAEQFGTLETLYPGRIDLGLGRAPGTDQRTLLALRRDPNAADTFPQDVLEVQALLAPVQPGRSCRRCRGEERACRSGSWAPACSAPSSPRCSACHTHSPRISRRPPYIKRSQVYRARFQPSAQLDRPYTMVGVNVVAADTDQEAHRLFTSVQQQFANRFRGARGQLPPPIDDIETYWSPAEKEQASAMLACSFVGSGDTVAVGLNVLGGDTARRDHGGFGHLRP